MSRLRQLAMDWEQRAADDAAVASSHETVCNEFRAIAHTRRNCAWELLRVLSELEKEDPADGEVPAP